MKRTLYFLSLVLACCSLFAEETAAPAVSPEPSKEKPSRHYKILEELDKQDAAAFPAPGGNVFIGSSSIEMWKDMQKKFAPAAVIKRGVGGSGIADAVNWADKYAIAYAPKRIFLYSGDNDLFKSDADQYIFDQYKLFVEKVSTALPQAKIYWIGIKPSPKRAKFMDKARKVNELVKEYIKDKPNLGCIDLWNSFLDKSGQPDPSFFRPDQLHFNESGYKIWEEAIKPLLSE